MSKRKNLKWICRRCEKKQKGLEVEHDTELQKPCSFCGTETWCFLVASSRLVKNKPPQETVVEAESIEVNEAVLIAAGEAVEDIVEVIERQKESPEETAPAEALEPTEEEVAVESPEAEVEAESIKELTKELKETGKIATIAERDKNAEIARLEAELAELQK